MAFDIPLYEPERVTAGDTWTWKRELSDFPAGTWTLKYRFKHQTNAGFEIVATASGTTHVVTVLASTTSGYSSGLYVGDGWVESGTEKYSIWHGELLVEIDFRATAAGAVVDGRTTARKIYDQLVAAYLTYSASGGGVQSYTIGDRQMTFSQHADFVKAISDWEVKVRNEEAADRLRSGESGARTLMVRL